MFIAGFIFGILLMALAVDWDIRENLGESLAKTYKEQGYIISVEKMINKIVKLDLDKD